MLVRFIDTLGLYTIQSCRLLGRFGLFFLDTLYTLTRTRPKVKKIIYQMNFIGVDSLIVILLTGISIGAILAVQGHIGLKRFGAVKLIGPVVFLSMSREFGPVLAAIMVAGRAGSAMTAEIGIMRISEQIDALKTLCINVKQFLIIPRIIAATLVLPLLSLVCTLFGVVSGYLIATTMLDVNAEMFMESIRQNVVLFDITSGLIKAVVFGFLVSVIATYKGYTARGGSRGVGLCTTQSVVYSSVTIIIADYILTSLMRHV